MADLDKMARELLRGEYQKAHAANPKCNFCTETWDVAIAAARAALLTAPPGYVLVPVELIDAFPEINPSNYDHDQACKLNAWGCQVVTTAAPEVN